MMHQKTSEWTFFIQEQHKLGNNSPSPAPISAPAAPPAPPPPPPSAPTPQQKAQASAPVNPVIGQQQTVLAPTDNKITDGVQKKALLGS